MIVHKVDLNTLKKLIHEVTYYNRYEANKIREEFNLTYTNMWNIP